MVKLRSQDGDSKEKEIVTEDPEEQRIARLEEFVAETKQQFAEILAKLNRFQGIQESDDRSTLDRGTSPSMKAWRSRSDVFEESREDRRFREYLMLRSDDDDETWTETDWWYRSEKENPEEQALDDEELVKTVVATESDGIDQQTVNNEENANGNLDILEEESIIQSQVPVSSLESSLQFHNASSDICDDFKSSLFGHQEAMLQVSHVKVRDALLTKSTDVTNNQAAHYLFVKMPSNEKRIKHRKAWKFKFKTTSKRSKLKDDRFSFVEETALLNKDHKETMWDYVKKEFKETMAACGKTRVDRFKLVHAAPRPGVYDKPLQSSVWDRGGSLLECVDEESFGDDKIKEWLFKVEEFFSIDFTSMELKVKLVTNHFDGDTANWHKSQVQTGQFGHLLIDWGPYKVLLKERFENVFEDSIAKLKQLQETRGVRDEIEPVTDKEKLVMPQIAVNANLGFSDYNNKRMKGTREKLGCEIKSAGLTRVSVTGGNKLRVLGLKKVEPITWRFKKMEMRLLRQFQELFEKLSLASMMFEQTFSSITEPKKILPSFFRLKHKWRSRLSHSFSEMKQWMIRRVWKSFGNVMEAHGSKYKGLGCVVEKKKLRNVGDDVTKGKISFLRDVKIILALAVKECRMGKAAARLLPGHYGLLHTFDQCGVNATVIAGTIIQSSLELFHRLRVACLHHTSPGFLYGSLPRPPDERNELVEEATWEFMFGFQKRFPELSA